MYKIPHSKTITHEIWCDAGVPFPKTFLPTVKKVLSRLFRVFVHVYIHHFDKMVALGAVSRLVVARQQWSTCIGSQQGCQKKRLWNLNVTTGLIIFHVTKSVFMQCLINVKRKKLSEKIISLDIEVCCFWLLRRPFSGAHC